MSTGVLVGGIVLLLFWGIWGVTIKVAMQSIGLQVVVWVQLAQTLIFPLYFLVFKDLLPLKLEGPAILWAMFSGAISLIGTLMLYLLLRVAPTSIVIPLSALYPIITIALAFLVLHERITAQQWLGIVFALIAIALLTIDFGQILQKPR